MLRPLKFPEMPGSSVTQSCPTLCDPMNRSTPGLPVHHQLPPLCSLSTHKEPDRQCRRCGRQRPLEGKQRTSLSSRVATRVSWSPLSGPNAPGKAPNNIHTTLRWGRAPGKPHARRAAAKRSYPTSEVRGSGRECQAATAQERRRRASPDTPGSPEGNTEGPGTASSEPLLPS